MYFVNHDYKANIINIVIIVMVIVMFILQHNGEAQEVLSLRQGPIRVLTILPTPTPGKTQPTGVATGLKKCDLNDLFCVGISADHSFIQSFIHSFI